MTIQANKARPLFDPPIVRRALGDSFRKLDPRHQVKNPVMFVVEVGSLLTTALAIQALLGQGEAPSGRRRGLRCPRARGAGSTGLGGVKTKL
jgi:K+-transporting ATPase ATPase B chain